MTKANFSEIKTLANPENENSNSFEERSKEESNNSTISSPTKSK